MTDQPLKNPFEELKKLYKELEGEGRGKEDVERRVMECDYLLIDPNKTNLGFPDECSTSVCMARRFEKEIPRIYDIQHILLLKMLEKNDVVSKPNGRCSRAYMGKYNDNSVAVLVYAYCDTKPEECPCRIPDDRFAGLIGKMNKSPLAIPVLGYCWNPKARVLWIVSKYCKKIDEKFSQIVSVQNSLFALSESYLRLKESDITDALKFKYKSTEDEMMLVAQPGIRPRDEKEKLIPLSPFQYFSCKQCYLDHGNPVLRQRHMEIVSPLSFCFVCAFVVPEINHFWCNRGTVKNEWGFETTVFSFPPYLHRILFREKCMSEDYWFHNHPEDFDRIYKFFKDEGEYIGWDRFFESISRFGIWWLHFEPFKQIWPTMRKEYPRKQDLGKQSEDVVLYFFRMGNDHITLYFQRVTDAPVNYIHLKLDTISKLYYVDGDHGIFSETPLGCLDLCLIRWCGKSFRFQPYREPGEIPSGYVNSGSSGYVNSGSSVYQNK